MRAAKSFQCSCQCQSFTATKLLFSGFLKLKESVGCFFFFLFSLEFSSHGVAANRQCVSLSPGFALIFCAVDMGVAWCSVYSCADLSF